MLNKDEDEVWANSRTEDFWIQDKLLLSKYLQYNCGPTGIDVPYPGWYITRPCVNAMGFGFGAEKVWLDFDTQHIPIGHFWCEFFEGKHYSVDWCPRNKTKLYTVKGTKEKDTFIRWNKWKKVPNRNEHWYPNRFHDALSHYDHINIEYIDNKIIEIHLRPNEDFYNKDIKEFIPVWENQDTTTPEGYEYIECPEPHGRIGAFIK